MGGERKKKGEKCCQDRNLSMESVIKAEGLVIWSRGKSEK